MNQLTSSGSLQLELSFHEKQKFSLISNISIISFITNLIMQMSVLIQQALHDSVGHGTNNVRKTQNIGHMSAHMTCQNSDMSNFINFGHPSHIRVAGPPPQLL